MVRCTSSWMRVRIDATSTWRPSSGARRRSRSTTSSDCSSSTRSATVRSGAAEAMSATRAGSVARAIAAATSGDTWPPAVTYSAYSWRTLPASASASVPRGLAVLEELVRRRPLLAVGVEREQPDALLALDERVGARAGDEPERADGGDDGDLVEVVEADVVRLGLALHGEDHPGVGVDGGLQARPPTAAGPRRAAPAGAGRRRCRAAAPPAAAAARSAGAAAGALVMGRGYPGPPGSTAPRPCRVGHGPVALEGVGEVRRWRRRCRCAAPPRARPRGRRRSSSTT